MDDAAITTIKGEVQRLETQLFAEPARVPA
jgi:hypothetical protein